MIRFTTKQIEILSVLRAGMEERDREKDENKLCTVYDLVEKVSHKSGHSEKRDNMLHSLQILIREGYVARVKEKRDGGYQRFYLTELGQEVI